MNNLTFILMIISILILTIGLIYTYRLGRALKLQQDEYDPELNEKVQDHPVMRNPIFITYLIALGLVVAYMIYLAVNSNW
ncbi:hypothetical protein ACSVDA_11305 [Cytobacillus sp. Hm23]|uniref:hypothetical protein n=1 Tax=Cytobacillus sp. IB215665 TaxID=3097357 RepID=UPI002A153C50|nr:hypothetical protein [Cytobacillus sp. IB215665]MDX8364873.1 hypothetical protein [Cytobacillus sp. IB215665]